VPETAGFAVSDEVAALARHGIEVDVVVADPDRPLGDLAAFAAPLPVCARPVAGPNGRVHDPALLAGALADLVL
jgi:hypothetical protein